MTTALRPIGTEPAHASYDVVIVGGAIMGSSAAWWLSRNPDFSGRILVVERDPTYAQASTTGTASCIRHQYSNPVNSNLSRLIDHMDGQNQQSLVRNTHDSDHCR